MVSLSCPAGGPPPWESPGRSGARPRFALKELLLKPEWWQVIWFLLLASGLRVPELSQRSAMRPPIPSTPAALVRVGIMIMVTLALQFAIIGRKIEVVSPLCKRVFICSSS